MKTLILTIALTVSASQTLASPRETILTLESQGRYALAVDEALRYFDEVRGSDAFKDVAAQVETSLTRINRQVVTRTEKSKMRWNKVESLNFVFGSTNSTSKGTVEEQKDFTTWILANAEDVSREQETMDSEEEALRQGLKSFILGHKAELYLLKTLATKALHLSQKMSDEEFMARYARLERAYSLASFFEFTGTHGITSCTVNEHAATLSTLEVDQETSRSFGILFFDRSESDKMQRSEQVESHAYQAKQCVRDTRQMHLTANKVLGYEFEGIERALKASDKGPAVRYLTLVQAPEFPTWGSPHYRKN
jgi:hypothetical protein